MMVTGLIMLMALLPIRLAWSACEHVQVQQQVAQMHMSDHHCCLEKNTLKVTNLQPGTCHCDQFQHAQFILDLPQLPIMAFPAHSQPWPALIQPVLTECADVLYRPPIV